jgi:hypothetical protein
MRTSCRGFHLKRIIVITALAWVVVISVLHAWLNLDVNWLELGAARDAEARFQIGFLPVT